MTHRVAPAIALGLAAAFLAVLPSSSTAAPAAAAAAGKVRITDGCLKSRPEPGTTEKVKICWTVFKPAGASTGHPVPLLMHSHVWGGSRTTDPSSAEIGPFIDAGYGVLSFDQRGFGESGGFAHVESPRFEGRDNLRLIRKVSRLPWVKQDGRGDPRLGALGGSYGGGYQFLGAFLELKRTGKPVYDALAPQITWNDLHESLGPQDVPRSQWSAALGAAAQGSDALEPPVEEALAEGVATGNWPDGSGPSGVDMNAYFRRNGPSFHIGQGRRLGIPVLLGQGTTDSLFNLQQGFDNWHGALTKKARRRSLFVGYNGGHVIPSSVPLGQAPTSDPCSRKLAGADFTQLTLRFFNEQLRGRSTGLTGYGKLHLATPDDTCTTVKQVRPRAEFPVAGTVATPAAGSAGPSVAYPVAEGPIRVAGSAYLTGALTTLGLSNRAFYGLAIGTSEADARLVQNNVYPLRVDEIVSAAKRRIELPAVAVDVPRGKTLFLIASAVSQDFGGVGSRTPTAVLLDNTVVHLREVGH